MRSITRPLVSICIPAYNCELFIESTLESVRAQTFTNFEVIIIDDCSTDGTAGRVEAWLDGCKDPRFTLLKNSVNQGLEANWNRASALARGEFLKLLCSDDLLEPNCLEEQVEILRRPENRSVVLTACSRRIIDGFARELIPHWGARILRGRFTGPRIIRACARYGTNVLGEPCALLYRAAALKSAGTFSARLPYMIDVDLWTRVLEHGDAYLDSRVLCSFRVSAKSLSTLMAPHQTRQMRSFVKLLHERHPNLVTALDAFLGRVSATVLGNLRALYIGFISRRGSAGQGSSSELRPVERLDSRKRA